MIKRRRILNKSNIIAGIAFLVISFLILFKLPYASQEQKDYKEAEGEIVAVFREPVGEDDLERFAGKYKGLAEVIRHIGDYALFSVKEASDFNKVLESLSAEPQIKSAEANSPVSIMGTTNDPFSDTQWYMNNTGIYSSLYGAIKLDKESTKDIDMDVAEAWDAMAEAELADREVIVAVIDTGVDYMHPDLAENIWVNEGEIPGDNIDNDNNGYVDDVNGWDFYNDDSTVCHYTYSGLTKTRLASPEDNDNHGTHVAGIIAAVADNNIGIAGIASNINIKIMPLKINGGKKGDGNIANAIEAIKYATMMGADICNLSWGTFLYEASLEEVIRESDMLFVAAAGNSGENNDRKPMYPASLKLDNLISVTFVDADGDLTGYSNYGKASVDIAAPGDDIYSTVVGSYGTMSGSSMAAPQVSAVAALLYAYNDHLYASNIKDIITGNLKKLDKLKDVTVYGGMPNAYKAVMASGALVRDMEAPRLTLSTIFSQGEMTVPVLAEDPGNSRIRVVKWIYGEKTAADFLHGINGTTVKSNQVNLSKAGMYTFYAADYAGNETVMTYEVAEDTTAPKLTTTFSVADNYESRTVVVTVSDEQSGIKRVKYMPGMKRAQDFLPSGAGTEIKIKDGKGRFKVGNDGIYTVFATDNRGNVTAKPIIIKTVKAAEFKFVLNEKTLDIGEQFNLRTVVRPTGSTDTITYTSSDEKVAVISPTGKVTALAEGKALITARTTSGLVSTCLITVELKE
jgi:subtilisin family serine protease